MRDNLKSHFIRVVTQQNVYEDIRRRDHTDTVYIIKIKNRSDITQKYSKKENVIATSITTNEINVKY